MLVEESRERREEGKGGCCNSTGGRQVEEIGGRGEKEKGEAGHGEQSAWQWRKRVD